MGAQHTPGPWVKAGDDLEVSVDIEGDDGLVASGWQAFWNPECPEMAIVVVDLNQQNVWDDELLDANASLISAAPDHADIGWAMCIAAGRWEAWGDGRGEFCLNGLRFTTKLDPFGIPEVTEPLRAQIAKARGEA